MTLTGKEEREQVKEVTPVCGICASVDGVRALQRFFSRIDPLLGLAYVVVIHGVPDHDSQIPDIIGRQTSMPVRWIGDASPLEPDHVYFMPADRQPVIDGTDIYARPIIEPRSESPVDLLFQSLAAGRDDGLAVVLSGAGSDGATGLRKLKEAGGVIFVQDPSEAEYGTMPRSAIATGVADFIEPIDRLTACIVEVVQSKAAEGHIGKGETEDEQIGRLGEELRLAREQLRACRREHIAATQSYRGLFEAMNAGYLLAEAQRDASGNPEAIVIRDATPAARRLLNGELMGKRFSPADDDAGVYWLKLAEEVLLGGDGIRQEIQDSSTNLWFEVGASRVDDNRVAMLVQDVTQRKRYADERELMVGELNHRVKNMLAVVQSIARQTLRSTDDPEVFTDAFSQRLEALTRAHGLLTQDHWRGADLRELALTILGSFTARAEERFDLDGPPARLSPNATISFAMALHELATNALKYGALSTPEGRISLSWAWNGPPRKRRFQFSWDESGGPPVVAPSRTGFGSRLLKGVARELNGTVTVTYPAEGLQCTVDLPAGKVMSDDDA